MHVGPLVPPRPVSGLARDQTFSGEFSFHGRAVFNVFFNGLEFPFPVTAAGCAADLMLMLMLTNVNLPEVSDVTRYVVVLNLKEETP